MLFGEGINADFIATPLREKEQSLGLISLSNGIEYREADRVIEFIDIVLLYYTCCERRSSCASSFSRIWSKVFLHIIIRLCVCRAYIMRGKFIRKISGVSFS